VTELFLAMSHHRCGRPDEARAAYRRAVAIVEASVPPPGGDAALAPMRNRLVCHAILREARAVLDEAR
jgi:hypothetical protein